MELVLSCRLSCSTSGAELNTPPPLIPEKRNTAHYTILGTYKDTITKILLKHPPLSII